MNKEKFEKARKRIDFCIGDWRDKILLLAIHDFRTQEEAMEKLSPTYPLLIKKTTTIKYKILNQGGK